MPLSSVAEGVWTDTDPVRIVGMPLSATMTLLHLNEGELLVHSPVALTEERRQAIAALGTVSHLVAPNLFHHQWIMDWALAYPAAELHVPYGLPKKRQDLPASRVKTLEAGAEFAGALEVLPIDGCRLGETALLYQPARVLLVADLVHNIGRPDGAWTRFYTQTMGFYDRVAQSRVLRWTAYSDTAAARRSADRILDWDFSTLVVGHGTPVRQGAKDALREALSWLG
ncbi:MAG TPA: DUF4336 domain-containing protein [Polyangiaceae bacterium]|nr:DUF4336 domain-containing protein [Polyangiaceae bacterium]